MNDLESLVREKKAHGLDRGQENCLREKKALFPIILRVTSPELHAEAEFQLLLGRYYRFDEKSLYAREAYTKVLAKNPDHPRANWEMASLAFDDGSTGEERKYLRQVTDSKSKDPMDREVISTAFNRLSELIDSDEREEFTKRWLARDEKNARAWLFAAETDFLRGDMSAFADKLDRYQRSNPSSILDRLFWYLRAELSSKNGEKERAVKEFGSFLNATTSSDPHYRAARTGLVRAHLALGNFATARALIEEDLALKPNDRGWQELHEQSFENGPDTKEFFVELERAGAANPRSIQLQLWIVERLTGSAVIKKEFPDAFRLKSINAHLDKVLGLDPKNIDALYFKGLVAMERKSFTRADVSLSQVLAMLREGKSPRLPRRKVDLWMRVADLESARGHRGEARSILNEALSRETSKEARAELQERLAKLAP